jgi:hypothetical protein
MVGLINYMSVGGATLLLGTTVDFYVSDTVKAVLQFNSETGCTPRH